MDRNVTILENKREILERRKAELLRAIAEKESRLSDLSAQYELRAAESRRWAATYLSDVQEPAKDPERERRLVRQDSRAAFIAGLCLSLLIGMIVVSGRLHRSSERSQRPAPEAGP